MPTWKLTIEYEGTRYAGWQRQPHARTVQGELTRAAEEFFGTEIEIGGSGRTDAGVHALAQVAHLRARQADDSLSPAKIRAGINKNLPHDINILKAQNAPHDFHARHNARSRYYLYQISTRRTAFGKTFVWWVRNRLDVARMQAACASLIGRHDFRSFSERDESQTSTIVEVERAQIFTHGSLILFRIGASHFLWKMVRRLVGALVETGRGSLSPVEFEKLLRSRSNAPAAWTAPPSGLFLERVLYDNETAPDAHAPAFAVS